MKNSQKGFAVLEGLLILVIIGIIGGTGWYVIHSKNQTDQTLTAAASTNQTPTAKTTAKKSATTPTNQPYLTIKEWGVRAPYDGTDTFTYTMSAGGGTAALFTSKYLADTYGCTDFGAGQIDRYAPSDDVSADGTGGLTAQQDAAQNPTTYTHVGNYYYRFTHDHAACSDSVTVDAQNAASNEVQALVPKLQVLPN